MRNNRVLISGAGIAGPTLAYWLRRRGFTPTIVERAPAPRTGGYMIDFWGVGYDVADRMDLLPTLDQDGYRIRAVWLVDAAGKRVSGFDADLFRAASHDRFLSLLRGDLAHRIYEMIEHDVETIFGDSIAALEEDASGVTVAFERAASRRFDLVVGADGLHSRVRALAFDESARAEKYLGYYAAAFSTNDYPHRDEGVYISYSTPGRQVARYALRDGRSVFFFLFARDEPIAHVDHDVAAQRALLRQVFGGAGWECDEILATMDRADDLYFDAVAQTRLENWSHDRVVLVGDAAYCPSLLAGQGSAFAMAGAYVLAHALAESGGDHTAGFAEYQRSFKPFLDGKQDAAAHFGDWFAPRTRFRLWLRNRITTLMRFPLVGEQIAARSFGDRFTLPGEPERDE